MTWIIFIIGAVLLLFDHEDDGRDITAVAILVIRGFGLILMLVAAFINSLAGA